MYNIDHLRQLSPLADCLQPVNQTTAQHSSTVAQTGFLLNPLTHTEESLSSAQDCLSSALLPSSTNTITITSVLQHVPSTGSSQLL